MNHTASILCLLSLLWLSPLSAETVPFDYELQDVEMEPTVEPAVEREPTSTRRPRKTVPNHIVAEDATPAPPLTDTEIIEFVIYDDGELEEARSRQEEFQRSIPPVPDTKKAQRQSLPAVVHKTPPATAPKTPVAHKQPPLTTPKKTVVQKTPLFTTPKKTEAIVVAPEPTKNTKPLIPPIVIKPRFDPKAPKPKPIEEYYVKEKLRGPAINPQMLRSVTVISTLDKSGYQLATPIQKAVAKLFLQRGYQSVEMAPYQLPIFDEPRTNAAHKILSSELIVHAVVDLDRVSFYMYDKQLPFQYSVGMSELNTRISPRINAEPLGHSIREAFEEVCEQHESGNYTFFPRYTPKEEEIEQSRELAQDRRATQAGTLYREFSYMDARPLYVGIDLGMARFAAANNSASTVNVGAFIGYRGITKNVSLELGFDVSSYAVASLDVRYDIPLETKYVYFALSAGVMRTVFLATENVGFVATNIAIGQNFAGPGFSFEIPLLGAIIRGELKAYFGDGSFIFGTYGVHYSIPI